MERFLHLHGLSVGYPTRKVLENIELEIEKGEILTLIGPNGAGKSTLLKSISGQLPLLAGSVLMQGQDLAKCDSKERARRIAVVLTEAVRPEYMTCREVCAAGRYPYTGRMGILRKEDEEAVDRAMARMKVEDLAERDFGAISDGQKQRVLVARALAQETPVLLMDEPTSYLDIRYRTELMETLRGLAAEGKTILMSLHEIDLALEVSDRLLCVKEGGEVFCGTPQEVLTGERIRDLFGKSRPGSPYAAGPHLFHKSKLQVFPLPQDRRSRQFQLSVLLLPPLCDGAGLRGPFPLYKEERQGLHGMSCPPQERELSCHYGQAARMESPWADGCSA